MKKTLNLSEICSIDMEFKDRDGKVIAKGTLHGNYLNYLARPISFSFETTYDDFISTDRVKLREVSIIGMEMTIDMSEEAERAESG